MRVLITGANGLVASFLIHRLAEKSGHDLYLTSRGNRRHMLGGESYCNCDLENADEVNKLIEWARPDVIVHTAAQSHVDRCAEDPEAALRANVSTLRNIINSATSTNPHIIHLSSDFVFRGDSKEPLNELEQREPVNFYGKTKVMSEDLMMTYPRATILRTVLVYGSIPWSSRGNFVAWVQSSLRAGNKIEVVDDQIRTPTWAGDLAAAIQRIIDKSALGIYHISGGEKLSVYQFARRVAEENTLNADLIRAIGSSELANQKDPRPKQTVFDISKSRDSLEFNPVDICEGLLRFEEMQAFFAGQAL